MESGPGNMNHNTLAIIIQEGGKIVTELLRNRVLLFPQSEPTREEPPMQEPEPEHTPAAETSDKATAIATGCVPCSIGHIGTCSGLLNEAMRFARKDGIESDEVINRVNMCMDELNSLERVDLRPEMIHALPEWEKSLAEQALNLSRSLRHELEGLSDVPALEKICATTQTTRQHIGRTWMRERLQRMPPEQREKVEEELQRRAATQQEDGEPQ